MVIQATPKMNPQVSGLKKGWLRSNNRWYGLIYRVLLCCLNPHHRKRILDDTGISFLECSVTSNKCPHMEPKSLHRQKTLQGLVILLVRTGPGLGHRSCGPWTIDGPLFFQHYGCNWTSPWQWYHVMNDTYEMYRKWQYYHRSSIGHP